MTEPIDYMITVDGEKVDSEWFKDAPTREFVEDRVQPLTKPEQLDLLRAMQLEVAAVAQKYIDEFVAIDGPITVRLKPQAQMIELTISKFRHFAMGHLQNQAPRADPTLAKRADQGMCPD